MPIPAAVAALVGPTPEDRSGEGAGRVLVGNGHVARLGPAGPFAHLLPPLLARLLAEPGPLLDVLGAEPVTLLHGDPWPANIRRTGPGRRVWLDWEQASVGPAAADLATWLDQTPWFLRGEIDVAGHRGRYLAARRRPVDPVAFTRAVDAASVVWFLAFDVPRLPEAPPWLAEHMVSAREEAAARVLD